MRSCTSEKGPQGLSAQRQARKIAVAGFVGCRPGGTSASRDAARISKLAWKTSTAPSASASVANAGSWGARAPSAVRSAVPTSTSAPTLELRHHLGREQAQALQHLGLRQGLDRVHEEVDAVHADRLPALDRARDLLRIADADAFRRGAPAAGIAGIAAAGRREIAERLVGARRVRLARPQEVRVGEAEEAEHAQPALRGDCAVLVAVEEVQG